MSEQTTRCRAIIEELKVNIDEPPAVIVASLSSLTEELQRLANQTLETLETLETLKGRQAISGGLQAISLTI